MKSLGSAYVNLLKTSIGSGVLNFPFLFRTYGILLTLVLTLVSGFFACMGLVLLIICSQLIGRSSDLSKLATLSVPYTKFFVDFSVFFKCFGVATSYLIITKSILPQVLSTLLGYDSVFTNPSLCLLLFVLVIGPFCYLKKMDRLKYTSFLGLLCIVFVIFATIWRFFFDEYPRPHITFAPTEFSNDWLSGLGKFIFSFTCHQNIFTIYSELADNSLPRMKKLIYFTCCSSFVLYMVFGIFNYLLFGDKVSDNVLSDYREDVLTNIVRGLYVVVMGVSYPLQLGPGKNYFLNMMNIKPKNSFYSHINFLVTTVLIIVTYIIGVSGVGLSVVYAIVGSTASTMMCLILPALYYFNLDVEKSLWYTVIAYCAFLFGIIVFGCTMVSIIYKMNKGI